VFPSEEDFGIVIVEAMAAGKPVIAYGRGEALDSVVDGSTGIFFGSQTVEAIVSAIARLEAIEHRFEPRYHRHSGSRVNLGTSQKTRFCERSYHGWPVLNNR
jgi:glycosyltransferase involved in cell wall biosynthesis